MPLLRLLYGWLLCRLLSRQHLPSTGTFASCRPSLPSTLFLLWRSSSRLPLRHRHHVPLDKCWEKRRACGGGLSTRPPPSFSSLSLATFDCCVIVVVVVVVRFPSSSCHHLNLFVGAASAIILQQTTLTSSLLPLLPTPFCMADCCVGVGLMGRVCR